MITLKLNIDKKDKNIQVTDEVLINSVLNQNPKIINKLIKSMAPFYKISKDYFDIVNPFIDYNSNGEALYAGLIVRVAIDTYVILYLEGYSIDEKAALLLIDEYIKDIEDFQPKEINIDTFKIKKKKLKKILDNL